MKERERRLAGAGRQRNNKAPKGRPSKRAPERRPSRIRRIRRDHLVVIFDFSEATYVDNSAAMVIKQLMDVAREERTGLIVMGVSDAVAPTLQALSVFRQVPKQQVVSTLDEARRSLQTSSGIDAGESKRDGVFFRRSDFHPGSDVS